MSAPKGKRQKTGGRQKGTPNKATLAARESIGMLIDGNVDKIQGWLDEIERNEGALAAFRCFVDLLEFSVPKLARTEVTGKDGGEIEAITRIELVGLAGSDRSTA